MIYAIGKGPSAVTASAPNTGLSLGSSVIITGTVTDKSPGTNSIEMKARFPNGVPAVSDEDMSDWMRYVYKQFERPMMASGVELRILTVDPAGNFAWIGTVTSDMFGNYQYSFIPQMEGTYTVLVSFVGTEAYYGSETTAYVQVDPAPAPYPTVTIPPYPGYQGPSAAQVANAVVSQMPPYPGYQGPSASTIASQTVSQIPEYPEPTVVPEYTMIQLFIVIIAALALIVGIIILMKVRQ